ncbi:hypothetical protein BO86DRAFT_388399 [Aspergillus japonicus CBS 114.51]|uniref:Secreted protein n=2 Tax=Aspergillus TaxID=5052 RepID=A0A2V5HKM2_ASPV1|nr:hypothetical protein BO86DRAFT_388399 [Aspergillus japonicus CBS 114.51]PYI24301.1 hypothetical protein BO99DRAFT_398374 [Aspergillus violaceofuscus CBS 115571]RAH82891.1 hypothetical protein BO86DRAFT_388399 [Aspergillus japonicus CBS 114.51]
MVLLLLRLLLLLRRGGGRGCEATGLEGWGRAYVLGVVSYILTSGSEGEGWGYTVLSCAFYKLSENDLWLWYGAVSHI